MFPNSRFKLNLNFVSSRNLLLFAFTIVCIILAHQIYKYLNYQDNSDISLSISSVTNISISMAWRSSGSTNLELIQNLKKNGLIKSAKVEKAMSTVDRANYCSKNSYFDSPQPIGFGVTISAPHMHANTLELLKDHLYEGANALDVGSGSGYLTACMGIMVGPKGQVYGIDHISQLVEKSIANIEKDQPQLIKTGRVKMIGDCFYSILFYSNHFFFIAVFFIALVGDGRQGHASQAPYDAIHVGAAAPELPQAVS